MAMAESIALAQAQWGKIPGVEEILSEIEALETEETSALLAKEFEVSECERAPNAMAGPLPEDRDPRAVEFSLFFFSGDESAFPITNTGSCSGDKVR